MLCATSVFGQSPQVGGGAPTPGIRQAFIYGYSRGIFQTLVGNPLGNVTSYGATGYIQQFPGASNANITLALIKPDSSDAENVQQVLAAMFSYYGSVGVGNAGYPTNDTLSCPGLISVTANSCQWQPFSNNYALFIFASPLRPGAQNFLARDPFYTKWSGLGGITDIGPATSAETQVTSPYGSVATYQTFDQGTIFNITSGTVSGRLLAVTGAINTLYLQNGGATGALGLPTTSPLALSNGSIQQTFESGAIQFNPATGVAVLAPSVATVAITPSGSIQLNVGASITAQATLYAADTSVLTDRAVAWNTSNGRVVAITSNGASATLKAVGAGVANITATSGGKTSPALTITVTAPCCQIGQGAPTIAIQQAFQNAVARDQLNVQLPAASEVVRLGNGYVQTLQGATTPPVQYLIAVADGSVTGYVVSGPILAAYMTVGGPAGSLGFPLADATPGGRQLFQGGALAGSPVQLVTGNILQKWASRGYETGAIGLPTSGVSSFFTFRGTSGNMQAFQNAQILAATAGPQAGQAFVVSGLILAQYTANNGPAGDLGAPLNDEYSASGLRQQDFEGGGISYMAGASSAVVSENPRQPLVIATPSTVLSGTPVHLVAGGFNNGATVKVSQTGQPDFVVTVANGAYAWDVLVPATAAGGVVTVQASDLNSSATAQASYTVRSASGSLIAISVVSGDQQNGAPGAMLGLPLVVAVRDQDGNPIPGQVVTFAASPGGQVFPTSAITGSNGQASTTMRMPTSAGIGLATATTNGRVVTFGAKSSPISLTNFTALSQNVQGMIGNGTDTIQQKGALLTSVAAIVRYFQQLGRLPQTNGLASPVTLNQYLKSFCVADPQGNQICDGFVSFGQSTDQTVNLWRVPGFVGGGLTVNIGLPNLNAVRDLIASGSPVLLALALNGLGSHFVVATGIGADGSIVIADPNPAFGATNLNTYLKGFTSAGGSALQGILAAVVQLIPQAPAAAGFLVAGNAPVAVTSLSGACGQVLQFPGSAAVAGMSPGVTPGNVYFDACSGSAGGPYQFDIAAQSAYSATFTDLSAGGGRTPLSGSSSSSSEVVANGNGWTLAPLQTSISTGGVVNAASFTASIAPGGLVSIYGAGLVASGATTSVQVNGEQATVIAAYPFQVNAQIPFDIPSGSASLAVISGIGTAQQTVTVSDQAPAIFSISTGAAITNQDNSVNSPSNPAARGSTIVIYCTGLGTVSPSGSLNVANAPVTVVISGMAISATFAGLTPGATGLYQVNVVVPATLPPGLALPLYLVQSNAVSNTVTVAIQ